MRTDETIHDAILDVYIDGLLSRVDKDLFLRLYNDPQIFGCLGRLYNFIRIFSSLSFRDQPDYRDLARLIRAGVIYTPQQFIEACNVERCSFRKAYAAFYGEEIPVEE